MKNFLFFCGLWLTVSCGSSKHATAVDHPQNTPSSSSPVFLENITLRPGSSKTPVTEPIHITGNALPPWSPSAPIERCGALQFKYAILLEQQVEDVTNKKLISFLENWCGIPYKYGGGTKMGIDCSAFASLMMDSVYELHIPRTCREQYESAKKIRKSELGQGDLVFFNTTGGVSHVGVYLANDRFVHASTSGGVMISSLEESYFKRRYIGSARVR